MRAKREVKGLYALLEAFWDFTNVISCSIRGAILVAFCFLFGGILIIGFLFVIGHHHDNKLAAELRAQRLLQEEAQAKMARHGSVSGIPIAPHHLGYPAAHAVYPSHQPSHQAYPAAHAVVPPHQAYPAAHAVVPPHQAYPAAHAVAPPHQAYPAAHAVVPPHQAYPAAHAAYPANSYPQAQPPAYQTHGYAVPATAYSRGHAYQAPNSYPTQPYQYGGFQQPTHPAALDPIYESTAQPQYRQMIQTTPMVANPYGTGALADATPAAMDRPPSHFGSPRADHNPAIADANDYAGAESGRAEAEGSGSMLNTY